MPTCPMIRLALVMTKYIDFKEWEKTGLLDREIRLYQNMEGVQTIFYHDNEEEVEYQGFQFRSKKFLKTDTIDIFKSNQFYGAEEAYEIAESRNIPFVFRCGYSWAEFERKKNISFVRKWSARRRESRLAKLADVCVVSNKMDKELFVNCYKIDEEKVLVHPNWVDVNLFSPESVKVKEPIVISVGRLEKQKNQSLLVEAVSKLNNIKLIIVGEGSLKQKLLDRAASLKVDLKIKEPMPYVDLRNEMAQASVFVLPSKYEGLPKVLLEAMALGLRSVSTKIEAVQDVIKHDFNGYISSFSADDLAEKIAVALQGDNKDMPTNARETIMQRFSSEAVKTMELELLESILYGKSGRAQ